MTMYWQAAHYKMFEYFNAAQADIHYAVISAISLANTVLIPNLPTISKWSAQANLLWERILLSLQWKTCRMFTNKKKKNQTNTVLE